MEPAEAKSEKKIQRKSEKPDGPGGILNRYFGTYARGQAAGAGSDGSGAPEPPGLVKAPFDEGGA